MFQCNNSRRRTRRKKRQKLTTKDNRHDKKTAGEITPEADEPVQQHLVPGDTALKTSHTSQLLDKKLASEKERNLASSTSTLPNSHTIVEPVNKSAPLIKIITKAQGKRIELRVLTRPGVFSAIQGILMATRVAPEAKAAIQPADTAEQKTLAGNMLALKMPRRPTISIVSIGL